MVDQWSAEWSLKNTCLDYPVFTPSFSLSIHSEFPWGPSSILGIQGFTRCGSLPLAAEKAGPRSQARAILITPVLGVMRGSSFETSVEILRKKQLLFLNWLTGRTVSLVLLKSEPQQERKKPNEQEKSAPCRGKPS